MFKVVTPGQDLEEAQYVLGSREDAERVRYKTGGIIVPLTPQEWNDICDDIWGEEDG